MAKDEGKWYDAGNFFTNKDRNLTVLGIIFVAMIYAKLTGDTKPLAVFVFVFSAIFLFNLVNFILGKINS